MNNDLTALAADRAKLLWDKWKHHDVLAYARLQQYLQLVAFVATAAALLWTRGSGHLAAAALFFGAGCGLPYTWMFAKDTKVRNAFNLALVESLNDAGFINFPTNETARRSWSPSDHKNPYNQWHVSPVEHLSGAGRASLEARLVIAAVAILQLLLALIALARG